MNANSIDPDFPVTICPPGKRAGGKLREPSPSTIPLTTKTALVMPGKSSSVPIVPSAKGDRRTAQERIEAAERAEALSVALSQPDKQGLASAAEAGLPGSLTARLSEPLGRACRRWWPRDEDWEVSMYRAGCGYDEIIRDSLIAMGLPYLGQAGGHGDFEPLTPEQQAAQKEIALARRKRADEILVRVHARGARVMEKLVYDKREPSPYDEGILRNGLYALADWLQLIDRGINADRA